MKDKYSSVGLNYDLIIEKFPNLNDYEDAVNAYFADPFFVELKQMLIDEDYALAKDATKGLYILASELLIFPLYESLLEIFEDLEYESYKDVLKHYDLMFEKYNKIRSIFNA